MESDSTGERKILRLAPGRKPSSMQSEMHIIVIVQQWPHIIFCRKLLKNNPDTFGALTKGKEYFSMTEGNSTKEQAVQTEDIN